MPEFSRVLPVSPEASVSRTAKIALPFAVSPRRPHRSLAVLLSMVTLLTTIAAAGCSTEATNESTNRAAENAEEVSPKQGGPRAISGRFATARVGANMADIEALTDDPDVNVSVEQWDAIVTQIKATGKPTIVDVWSLSCEPCMREFPGLVELHDTYGDAIACISVNTDYDGRKAHPPESYLSRVNSFLEAMVAKNTNFIASTPNEDLYSTIQIPSIPAVLIYDADGNEIKRFVDVGETAGFTYAEDVIPFVRDTFELVAATAPETDTPEGETSADAATEDSTATAEPTAAEDNADDTTADNSDNAEAAAPTTDQGADN